VKKLDTLKLLIYAHGASMLYNESIPSKTHLQREMFLLSKETVFSKIQGYNFVPHYYGPFSRELVSDLFELVESGIVNEEDGLTLTPAGFKSTQQTWNGLDQSQKVALSRIKRKYNRISPEDLINYVCKKYTKYFGNSTMALDNLYNYFDKFALDNELTVEDLDIAFDKIRHPQIEIGCLFIRYLGNIIKAFSKFP
jgi:uncharacterized protein YwgA